VSSNDDEIVGTYIAKLSGIYNETYTYKDGNSMQPVGLQIIAIEGKSVEFNKKEHARCSALNSVTNP
jgi:hypothetical protein